jgi:hypothetical protein
MRSTKTMVRNGWATISTQRRMPRDNIQEIKRSIVKTMKRERSAKVRTTKKKKRKTIWMTTSRRLNALIRSARLPHRRK